MLGLPQLFLMVNGREAQGASGRGANQLDISALGGSLGSAADGGSDDSDTRALSRCEFLQCLVRLAVMKYVQPQRIPDVSKAVRHLLESDVAPNVKGSSMIDTNAFRLEACYQVRARA